MGVGGLAEVAGGYPNWSCKCADMQVHLRPCKISELNVMRIMHVPAVHVTEQVLPGVAGRWVPPLVLKDVAIKTKLDFFFCITDTPTLSAANRAIIFDMLSALQCHACQVHQSAHQPISIVFHIN